MYLDLHAHAGKRGCFMYGNHFDDLEVKSQSMLFAKLLSMNTLNFEYPECNFSEKLMSVKDKRDQGQSREGAGRVAIHKECGSLIRSYTLECNYAAGNRLNKLTDMMD
jgi:hypothetical protein